MKKAKLRDRIEQLNVAVQQARLSASSTQQWASRLARTQTLDLSAPAKGGYLRIDDRLYRVTDIAHRIESLPIPCDSGMGGLYAEHLPGPQTETLILTLTCSGEIPEGLR